MSHRLILRFAPSAAGSGNRARNFLSVFDNAKRLFHDIRRIEARRERARRVLLDRRHELEDTHEHAVFIGVEELIAALLTPLLFAAVPLTLRRNLFRGGIARTSLSSKVSTCQNC